MRIHIGNCVVVEGGGSREGGVVVNGDRIERVLREGEPIPDVDGEIDGEGRWLIPGIIDSHVHFREPGLTDKADIWHESRCGAMGGVTTFFDMPNTLPQTTCMEALEEKMERGRKESIINYSFFLGATNRNWKELREADKGRIPGIKLFMGSSTGDMLVDVREALDNIFSLEGLPIMAHCEDSGIIKRNMEEARKRWGDDPPIGLHPKIRSREACLRSVEKALEMAERHGSRLHVAHVSTKEEVGLLSEKHKANERITMEAVTGHIVFDKGDYERLGSKIKVNPAIKDREDRDAIRKAIKEGEINTIGTDHAPHLYKEKEGGSGKALSGMPIIQFSLPLLLSELEGEIGIERLVELMCHNPANIFGVRDRGHIREGYYADLVLVGKSERWKVKKEDIRSKCKWSPVEGKELGYRVYRTICNGRTIYKEGEIIEGEGGKAIEFDHGRE